MREGSLAGRFIKLWSIFVSVTLSILALAQEDIQPILPSASPETQLIDGWDRYIEAKREQDDFARKREFSAIQKQVQDTSGVVSEQASLLFLREGYRELDQGDFEEARTEFLNAAQLNPNLWPAYVGLARIKLERDGAYRDYVSLCLKGFRSAMQPENTAFILDAFIWLLERFLLVIKYSVVVFLLLLSAKYLRPSFATTVNGMEQKGFKKNMAQLVALIVLILPFFLGFNLILCAAAFMIIMFPFFEAREKATAVVCTISFALTSLLLLIMNSIVTAKANPDFRVQLNQFYRGSLEEQLNVLKERLAGEPDDKVRFAIAKLQKRSGQFSEALGYYEQLSERSKYWPLAQINIGNIYFSAHEYDKAISAYETAIRARPDMAVALYNLSITKSQLGEHRQAEEFLRKAKAADADLIDQIMIRTGMEQSSVVDADFDPVVTLKEALIGGLTKNSEPWYLYGFFLAPILFVIITLSAGLIHARIRHQRLLAKSCTKCGNLFFVSESPNHEWCSQCVNLYVKKSDLPSEAKINKYEEVQTFNRRKRRIIAAVQILFPGAKSIAKGSTWGGWITLTVWIGLLVFCFSSITDISYSFMRYLRDDLIFDVFIWGTTLVYWLIFGLRALWRED